ncbi:MAG: hypothetical protein JRJ19_09510 [Deltaproteobacteria bacterium]|nr:hypothetical protein [Deltaproteobacteria bacterium]
MRVTWLTIFLMLFFAAPLLAEDEDDWGEESEWEELDENQGEKKDDKEVWPMMLGTHTLPAGDFGFRISAGVQSLIVGAHVGVHDRVDLLADTFLPHSDIGNTWMAGGGVKVRVYGHGNWAYAFKFRVYGTFYSETNDTVKDLPESIAVWPSFMIGMNVKEGCFYAEIGTLLNVHTFSESTGSYVFSAFPAHFGGEIYITDWFHVFINVDIVISAHFGVFGLGLTGPFQLIEGGFVFLI